MKESFGLVCACGSDEVSEFWRTEDLVMGSTCALVFSSDEIMGSEFVCVMGEGVGLLGCVCLSALDSNLIFAWLTDEPIANFSVFETLSWVVLTGGPVAQCPPCSVSVSP